MKKLVLSFILLFSSLGFAGTEGTGGGDGYKCPTPDSAYPYYNLRLVDTWGDMSLDEIVQDNVGQLMDPVGMRTLTRFINRQMPAATFDHPFIAGEKIPFGTFLLLRFNQLYFYHSDLPVRLRDIPDDNIWWWQVPRGCKKIQLAIQNFANSTVLMNWHTTNMPVIDKLFLHLHETLMSIRNQPDLNTRPVRLAVERVANMVRLRRADFVRGLTLDYYNSLLLPESVRDIVMPRTLRCRTTYKVPRINKYQPESTLPSVFLLTRVSGSGKDGDHNVYQIATGSGATAQSFHTEMFHQMTIYSEQVANMIHAFETKFELPSGVTYTLGIYDRINEAGVYVGSVQPRYSNKATDLKSGLQSTHEFYGGVGLICAPL